MANNYTPVNAAAAPGVDYDAYLKEIDKQKQYLAQNPGVAQGADLDALTKQYADVVNSTLQGASGNSANGFWTDDRSQAQRAEQMGYQVKQEDYDPTGSNKREGYTVEGIRRETAEGTSGADEDLLDDASYAIIQQLKKEYESAKAAGDTAAMDAAHAQAEAIRANYGYTGGTDGSQYLTLGALGVKKDQNDQNDQNDQSYSYSGGESGGYSSGQSTDLSSQYSRTDVSGLRDLLEQWKAAALEQSNGQIDYAVQQAVTELERALEDAQPQFKEQAEYIAKEERQDLDNSALYAEARGDKGGIGQSQYNEIQAAAAQNQLAVQQAQTKLATDTARQIADLRAQGEFEKADKALEISQSYLSQLLSLEQWAAEYNLSYDQFLASLQQWEAEYELAMAQFQTSVDQWQQEFDFSKQQFAFNSDLALKQYETDKDLSYGQLTGTIPSTGQLTLSGQSQLASMGEALLSAGIMPSSAQLSAMGMTESQAQAYLTAQQLQQASGSYSSGSSGGKTGSSGETGYEALFTAARANGYPKSYIYNHYKEYGFTSSTGMMEAYEEWLAQKEQQEKAEEASSRPAAGYLTDGSPEGGDTASGGTVRELTLKQAKGQLDRISNYNNKLAELQRWADSGLITDAELDELLDYIGA